MRVLSLEVRAIYFKAYEPTFSCLVVAKSAYIDLSICQRKNFADVIQVHCGQVFDVIMYIYIYIYNGKPQDWDYC